MKRRTLFLPIFFVLLLLVSVFCSINVSALEINGSANGGTNGAGTSLFHFHK